MSFKDWVRFLLERWLRYVETPKHERKELKQMRKVPWSVKWFGLIPFSMKMAVNRQRSRLRNRLMAKRPAREAD
ncbi:YqzE family protein [Laceyella putida]|uniref:YqzE family protein n=1 Tax=Laceyella putida TaxID=110101 RepID=A0ABW2RMK0_9BACL